MRPLHSAVRVGVVGAVLSTGAFAMHVRLEEQNRVRFHAERLAERSAILADLVRARGRSFCGLETLVGEPAAEYSRLLSLSTLTVQERPGVARYALPADWPWAPKDDPLHYSVLVKVDSNGQCPVISNVEVILPEY